MSEKYKKIIYPSTLAKICETIIHQCFFQLKSIHDWMECSYCIEELIEDLHDAISNNIAGGSYFARQCRRNINDLKAELKQINSQLKEDILQVDHCIKDILVRFGAEENAILFDKNGEEKELEDAISLWVFNSFSTYEKMKVPKGKKCKRKVIFDKLLGR